VCYFVECPIVLLNWNEILKTYSNKDSGDLIKRRKKYVFLAFFTTFLYTDHLDYLSDSCCPHIDLR
jgi:hypothetical protein